MSVRWAATSLVSGRFEPREVASGIGPLLDHFGWLRARGSGYVEVRRDESFPVLAIGFKDQRAVVQRMSEAGAIQVLHAGVPGDPAEVLVMDDLVLFDGEFVIDVSRLEKIVEQFATSGALVNVGEWREL